MALVNVRKKLKIDSTHTSDTPVNVSVSLPELVTAHVKEPGIVVLWQYHKIVWGRWEDGTIQLADNSKFSDEYILEARVFNTTEELHVYRRNGRYEGRYRYDRNDTDSTDSEYVDTMARLWGEAATVDVQNGYATLCDTERFLTMTIPVNEVAKWYGLVTRNYVTADETTGQAGYSDYRFVAIEAMDDVKGGTENGL